MKYELTDIKNERGLYRILALKDFNDVKVGDLGGWVASKANLSQDGNSWIYDDAEVFDDARVCDNALVFDHAKVYDYARVEGRARIGGNAQIYGISIVSGKAIVNEEMKIYGDSWISK
jgi:UDP-3-O-[3-hydroxymyristoyl] glucosamine N-acyltransferase